MDALSEGWYLSSMPLTVNILEARLLDKIAPGNPDEFLRLLNEACSILLYSGNWRWTRVPVEVAIVDNEVILPVTYECILAARLNDIAQDVVWQEFEYLPGGPGLIAVDGCGCNQYRLIDQGERDVAGVIRRVYKVTGNMDTMPETLSVLAKYRHTELLDPSSLPFCQNSSALKLMMLSIIYQEANDLDRARDFEGEARLKLDLDDRSYRGAAKQMFKPKLFGRGLKRKPTNFS